jgi:hypothetical protein
MTSDTPGYSWWSRTKLVDGTDLRLSARLPGETNISTLMYPRAVHWSLGPVNSAPGDLDGWVSAQVSGQRLTRWQIPKVASDTGAAGGLGSGAVYRTGHQGGALALLSICP